MPSYISCITVELADGWRHQDAGEKLLMLSQTRESLCFQRCICRSCGLPIKKSGD